MVSMRHTAGGLGGSISDGRRATVLGVLVLGAALLVFAGAFSFPDMASNHPYAAAVDELSDRGVINGFVDGTFGPEKAVTRQQFAKMIVLTLGLPVSEADT